QPVLHEGDQRVAAGEQLGLVAVLGEQGDGLGGRLGPLVVERDRDHCAPPEAWRTALTMLWYPVQRQRLPSSPSRTCCSVELGISSSSDSDGMTSPGVQYPHGGAWHSRSACCMGWRVPSTAANPSMVVISWPSACTANIVHDFTASPLRCTV